MKSIFAIIFYIFIQNISQIFGIICPNNCLSCYEDIKPLKTYIYCDSCDEGYELSKDQTYCVSFCENGLFYNRDQKSCEVSCSQYDLISNNQTLSCDQNPKCPIIRRIGVLFPSIISKVVISEKYNLIIAQLTEQNYLITWNLDDGQLKGKIDLGYFDFSTNQTLNQVIDILIPDDYPQETKYPQTGIVIVQYLYRYKVYDILSAQIIDYVYFEREIVGYSFDKYFAYVYFWNESRVFEVKNFVDSSTIINSQIGIQSAALIAYNSKFKQILIVSSEENEMQEYESTVAFIELDQTYVGNDIQICNMQYISEVVVLQNQQIQQLNHNQYEPLYLVFLQGVNQIQLISRSRCAIPLNISYNSYKYKKYKVKNMEKDNLITERYILLLEQYDLDSNEQFTILEYNQVNQQFDIIIQIPKDDEFYKLEITSNSIDDNILECIMTRTNKQHILYHVNITDKTVITNTFPNAHAFNFDFLYQTRQRIFVYVGYKTIALLKLTDQNDFSLFSLIQNYNSENNLIDGQQYSKTEDISQIYEDPEENLLIYYDSVSSLIKIVDLLSSRLILSIESQLFDKEICSFKVVKSGQNKFLITIGSKIKLHVYDFHTFQKVFQEDYENTQRIDTYFLQTYNINGEFIAFSKSKIFKFKISENGIIFDHIVLVLDSFEIYDLIFFEQNDQMNQWIYVLRSDEFEIFALDSQTLQPSEQIKKISLTRNGAREYTIDMEFKYITITSQDGYILVVDQNLNQILEHDLFQSTLKCLNPTYISIDYVFCLFEMTSIEDSSTSTLCIGIIDIQQDEMSCSMTIQKPKYLEFNRKESLLSYLNFQNDENILVFKEFYNGDFYDKFYKRFQNINIQNIFFFKQQNNRLNGYVNNTVGEIYKFKIDQNYQFVLKYDEQQNDPSIFTRSVSLWRKKGVIVETTDTQVQIYCLLKQHMIFSTKNEINYQCNSMIKQLIKTPDGFIFFICDKQLYGIFDEGIMEFKVFLVQESNLNNKPCLDGYLHIKQINKIIMFYDNQKAIQFNYQFNTESNQLNLTQDTIYSSYKGNFTQVIYSSTLSYIIYASKLSFQAMIGVYQLGVPDQIKTYYLNIQNIISMLFNEDIQLLVVLGPNYMYIIDSNYLYSILTINVLDKVATDLHLTSEYVFLQSEKAIYSYQISQIKTNFTNNMLQPIRYFTSGNIMSFNIFDDKIVISTDYITQITLFVFQISTGNTIALIPASQQKIPSYYTDTAFDQNTGYIYTIDHDGNIKVISSELGFVPCESLYTSIPLSKSAKIIKSQIIFDDRRNLLITWSNHHINVILLSMLKNDLVPTIERLQKGTFYWDRESFSVYLIDNNNILWIMKEQQQLSFLFQFEIYGGQLEMLFANSVDNLVVARSDTSIIILKNNQNINIDNYYSLYKQYILIYDLLSNNKLAKIFLTTKQNDIIVLDIQDFSIKNLYQFDNSIKILLKLNTKYILAADANSELVIFDQLTNVIVQKINQNQQYKIVDGQEMRVNNMEYFITLDTSLQLNIYQLKQNLYDRISSVQIQLNLSNININLSKKMITQAKFDIDKSRVFILYDQLRYIEAFTFYTNSTYRADVKIIEFPDIESKMEIFENYIFTYNQFQINIYKREDLSYYCLHKLKLTKIQIQRVFEVRSDMFLVNYNQENILSKLQDNKSNQKFQVDEDQGELLQTLSISKDNQRIISFSYDSFYQEVQLISGSQNFLYDQRYVLKNIGEIETCYENILATDQYVQQQKFDDIKFTLDLLNLQLKQLTFNVYIEKEFLKSKFDFSIVNYFELRFIENNSINAKQNNGSPQNIKEQTLIKKNQAFVTDARQIVGINKYIFKELSLKYYQRDQIRTIFQKNDIGFGQDAQELSFENIIIEDQEIINGSFNLKQTNQFYVKNFIIRNCTFYDSVYFNLEEVEKVIIQNLTVHNCTLSNTKIMNLQSTKNVRIENVFFYDNLLIDFTSTFIQIINSTLTNITSLNVSHNQINCTLFNILNFNSNNQLDKMRRIGPEDLKKIYLIKCYLVQNLLFNSVTFQRNIDIQLLYISSSTEYDSKRVTLYDNKIFMNNLKVIQNILYTIDMTKQLIDQDNNMLQSQQLQPFVIQGNLQQNQVAIIGFSFIKIFSSSIQIYNSTFINNKSPVTQGVIWIEQSQDIQISLSSFSYNSAAEGGAVYLSNGCRAYLQSSEFSTNQALFSGGAIVADEESELEIYTSKFDDNTSLCGGAIRTRLNSKLVYDDDTKESFLNNRAEIWGNDWSETKLLQMNIVKISSFQSGSANFQSLSKYTTQSVNSSAIVDDKTNEEKSFENYEVYSNQTGIIHGMRSGGSLSIVIQLKDQDGKIFSIPEKSIYNNITNNEFNQMSISIKSKSKNLIIQNDILTNLQKYTKEYQGFLFENVRFKIREFDYNTNATFLSNQNLNFVIELTSFYGNVSSLIQSIPFEIKMRACQQGEIFLKEKSNDGGVVCSICEKGSYSLENPMININQNNSINSQCKECPQSAQQCYKNQILIKDGYWRQSDHSDIIVSCYNEPSNCLAVTRNNQTFVCNEGHIGPLCESCDNYGNIWKKQYVSQFGFKCRICDPDQRWDSYIYVAVILIGFTLYLYVQVRNHNQSILKQQLGYYLRMIGIASIYTSCFRHGNRYKIKILLYFFQIVNAINRIEFYIPQVISYVFLTLGSPSTSMSLQTQCLLLKQPNQYELTIPLMYSQRIVAFLSPFMYFLGIILVHYLLLYVKMVNPLSTFLITSFVILSLYFQPNVIALIVSAISCRRIGDKFYIQSDIQYECFDQYHQKFVYIFFIPAIIFWLIVPLIFLKQLATVKCQQRESFQMLYKYGYLYSEYKSKFFYWEFIKILLRMVTTTCTTLFTEYYQQIQTFNLLIIVLYLICLLSFQPYKFKNLANLDLLTHILLIFMILLNLQHNYYLSETEQNIALSIFWMSIYLSYILTVGFSIFQESYRVLVRPFVIQKLDHLSKHFSCLKSIYGSTDQSSRKSQVLVFKRWKQVHLNLKYLIYLKRSRTTNKQNNYETIQAPSQQSQQDKLLQRPIHIKMNSIFKDSHLFQQSSFNNQNQSLNKKTLFQSFSNKVIFSNQNGQNNSNNNNNNNNNSSRDQSQSSAHSLSNHSPTRLTKEHLIFNINNTQSNQTSQLYESVMPDNINEIDQTKFNKNNQSMSRYNKNEDNVIYFDKSELNASMSEVELFKANYLNRNLNFATLINLNGFQQKLSNKNKLQSETTI